MILHNTNAHIYVHLVTFRIPTNKFVQNVIVNLIQDAKFVHLMNVKNVSTPF